MATSVLIENPPIPFWDDIPGGVAAGSIIRIKGLFQSAFNNSECTQINLCENSFGTMPLHLSIRFNHRIVVRNTFQHQRWEAEEKDGPFPFSPGQEFFMEIAVQPYGYQISVNGQHAWLFSHRLAYSRVTHMNISGPVIVWSVEYVTKNQAKQGNQQLTSNTRLVNRPFLPYTTNLPGTLAVGNALEIKGFFPAAIDKSSFTSINLCQNSVSTIALHISIRFNHRTVVRNSFRQGDWGTEEKAGPFPFAPGREFLMKIIVQPNAYKISVNGSSCWTFSHRIPYAIVDKLNIAGPVAITFVDYENKPPKPLQKQISIVNETPSPSLPPVYNPPVPFFYHINGGIKHGMMIYISGVPRINFERFTINLQCGQQRNRNQDIAFHMDVRGFSSTVVRNTRRGNQWEDEETAASFFPFAATIPFDMIVLVQNDKYMVAVNGRHFVEYYHRMPRFGRINTLKIDNHVTITSVRFDSQPGV